MTPPSKQSLARNEDDPPVEQPQSQVVVTPLQQEQDGPMFRWSAAITTQKEPIVVSPSPLSPHDDSPTNSTSRDWTSSSLREDEAATSFQTAPLDDGRGRNHGRWSQDTFQSVPQDYRMTPTHVRLPWIEESSTLECVASRMTKGFQRMMRNVIQSAVYNENTQTVQMKTREHVHMGIHFWKKRKDNNNDKTKDDTTPSSNHHLLLVEIQHIQGCSVAFHRYANFLLYTILTNYTTSTTTDPVHVRRLPQQSVIHYLEDNNRTTTTENAVETQETLLLPSTPPNKENPISPVIAYLKYRPPRKCDQVEFLNGNHEWKTSVYEVLVYCPMWKKYVQLPSPLLVTLKRFRRRGVRRQESQPPPPPPTEETLHQEIQTLKDLIEPEKQDKDAFSPPPNNKPCMETIMFNKTFIYVVLPLMTTTTDSPVSASRTS